MTMETMVMNETKTKMQQIFLKGQTRSQIADSMPPPASRGTGN
jgi:hypothetical protein